MKEYNLAFVSPGGGCAPKWAAGRSWAKPGGQAATELRKAGGDVRVRSAGRAATNSAQACSSWTTWPPRTSKVIDAYDLTKVDFDIEGPALAEGAANDTRAQAIAGCRSRHPETGRLVHAPRDARGAHPDALAV